MQFEIKLSVLYSFKLTTIKQLKKLVMLVQEIEEKKV